MAILVGNDLKNDWLIGSSSADTIKGYGGNDTLKGGGGADYIDGGTGIDTAMYVDSTAGVTVDLMTGRGYNGTAQGDRLVGIENLHGSSNEDHLTGDNGFNELYGLDGHDFLRGNGGFDRLDGGYGDDRLSGGAGGDLLIGGPGSDTASYYDSPTGISMSLASGTGAGGEAQGDLLVSIENLFGSQYDDVLYGDSAANILEGDRGADTLYGGAGGDVLTGYYGNDWLYGQQGDDLLQGLDGMDILEGGAGADFMLGGRDTDVYVWSSIDDTGKTMSTSDVVDFSPAEADLLDLGLVDADIYAPGNQTFTFIGTAAFSGTPGEINYFHSGGDTYIQMQTGLSSDVEGMIRILGIVTPEASWFVL